MARKVRSLHAEADRLGCKLFALMPRLYKDRAQSGEALTSTNAAWHEAMIAMTRAYGTIGELSQVLSEKAESMPEPANCPFVT
jgi:hypothetical protein